MTNCHDDKYMRHIFSKFDDQKNQSFLKWHKNCYKSDTSSKNIASYKSKNTKLTADIPADLCRGDIFQKHPLRTPFDSQKCVFCQKRSQNQKLSQVMTNNMQEKIRTISRSNPVFFARTGDNDLIASEIKYHAACLLTELRNLNKKSVENTNIEKTDNEALGKLFEEMEKGLENGKGYSTKSIGKRYREISG